MGAVATRGHQRRSGARRDHARAGQQRQRARNRQRTYERERQRSGDKSFNTALSRGFHAIALARKGQVAEVAAGLQGMPAGSVVGLGGGDDDSGTTAAAREGRVRFVIEGYLRLLSRNPAMVLGERRRGNVRLCRRAARTIGAARAAGVIGTFRNQGSRAGSARADLAGRRQANRRGRGNAQQSAGAPASDRDEKAGHEHRGRDRAPAGDTHADV